MILCEVIGTVVNTEHHPALDAEKLLAVAPINERGEAAGASFLAIDRAQAGKGDRVLVLREGSGIRQIVGRERGIAVGEAVKMEHPIRSMVVGVVDAVSVAKRRKRK